MKQTAFAAAVLNPAAAIPAGVVDSMGRPAHKRFSVYRNNVAAGLTRAMEASFPVIRKLVGAEFFAATAVEFALKHPPKSQMLMRYGDEFAGFLQTFPPVAHLGYLPDMARLEQAMRDSYHAADASAMPADALAALSEAEFLASKLILAPSLRLIASRWPICAIWRANMENGPAPVAIGEDVIILRLAFDPRPQVLPAGGAGFLHAIMAGETVGRALGKADPLFDLTAVLSVLLAGEAIVGLKT